MTQKTNGEGAAGGPLVLTPETDVRLRAVAVRVGEPAETFADALLAEALADYEDTLEGVDPSRGLPTPFASPVRRQPTWRRPPSI